MPSGKDIRNRGRAVNVSANPPNIAPPPPQGTRRQTPPRPVQPAVSEKKPKDKDEVEKKTGWKTWPAKILAIISYVLAFLAPLLILTLLAIPLVGLSKASAWGHVAIFVLFVLLSIFTGREQIEGQARITGKAILTRWWAIKLTVMVWWICTLIICLI